MTIPPLARSGLDRAAWRRTDPEWLAAAWRRGRVLVIDPAGRALYAPDRAALVLVDPAGAPDGERLFLGVDDRRVPYFAVVGPLPERAGARAVTLRQVGAGLSDRDAGLFTTAVALVNWHAGHVYSPVTGEPTVLGDGGWVRREPTGRQIFPRTDPAVIVLVHDGVAGPAGRCLLGHNAGWRGAGPRYFSAFAGFVEPGESAEAAAVREVYEEVGVTVSGLRYSGSQSWPFPASLMLAFTGRVEPDQRPRPDRTEILEARWFSRREVATLLSRRPDPAWAPPPATAESTWGSPEATDPAGAVAGADATGGSTAADAAGPEVALPGPASVAHHLIRQWLRDGSAP